MAKQRQEQQNTFEGGMNKDLSAEGVPQNQYRDAQNGRLVAVNKDKYKFQNLEGDEVFFSLPAVERRARWRLCFTPNEDPISIDLQFTVQLCLFNPDTGQYVCNDINGIVSTCGGGLQTFYTGATALQDLIDDMNNVCEITTTQDTCGCYIIYGNFVDFALFMGSTGYDLTVESVEIPEQTDLTILGYAYDSQDLVLFTGNTDAPSDPIVPAYGQVWKLDISAGGRSAGLGAAPDYFLVPATHLKYNDDLQFYRQYQIKDAELVRENDCLVHVYWTDNYNKPRVLEISQPGMINESPGQLAWQPEYVMGNISFQRYATGILPEGAYQYTYRLRSADGAVTQWSPPTQSIMCIGNSTNDYRNQVGDNVNNPTQKSIVLEITNIDGRFDQIEVATIFYIANPGLPQAVYITHKQFITSPTMTFIHSTDETIFGTVDISEIAIPNTPINRVKNIKVVNDRMVISNFCEPMGVSIDTTGITYDFISRTMQTDTRVPLGTDGAGNPLPTFLPTLAGGAYAGCYNGLDIVVGHNRITGPNPGFPEQPDIVSGFIDYKDGWTDFYNRGYWNDDKYRFGIVYFLKDGTPTPVQWIDDITFPALDNIAGNPAAAERSYQTSVAMGLVTHELIVNGIQFNGIDVSSIKDKISGFSIVRAVRDKRVIGQALAVNVFKYTLQDSSIPAPNTHDVYMSEYFDVSDALETTFDYPLPAGPAVPVGFVRLATDWTETQYTVSLLSPEIDFGYMDDAISSIKVVGRQSHYVGANPKLVTALGCTPDSGKGDSIVYKLYYDGTNFGGPAIGSEEVVTASQLLPPGNLGPSSAAYALGYTGMVAGVQFVTGSDNINAVLGLRTRIPKYGQQMVAELGSGFNSSAFGALFGGGVFPGLAGVTERTNQIPLVNLYNSKNPDEQYGGTSAAALAATQYIFTGHFQPVDDCNRGDMGDYVYDAVVFGGDCFTHDYDRIYNYRQHISNTNLDDDASMGVGPRNANQDGIWVSRGNAFIFPVQSSVNLAHRKGDIFLTAKNIAEPNTLAANDEEFLYEDVWSREADSRIYFGADPDATDCETCLPYTVAGSNAKIPGEETDKFRIFPVNERMEVQPTYGPINHGFILFDDQGQRYYFLQSLGFGFIIVNAQVLISSAPETIIGSGQLFQKPLYISRNYLGADHKMSFCQSDKSAYWWCMAIRDLVRFGGDGLTELGKEKDLRSFIDPDAGLLELGKTDNPLYLGGIHSIYNFEHDEVMFTLNPIIGSEESPFTLVYKEGDNVSRFSSFYTMYPRMWMSIWGSRLFSQDPTPSQRVYRHFVAPAGNYNLFYGAVDPAETYVQFIVNGEPNDTKILANFMLNLNRVWDLYDIETGKRQRWDGSAAILRTSSNMTQFQPRGGKWEGSISRVTSAVIQNLDGTPDVATTDYDLAKMEGEYFLVKLRVSSTEYREMLDAVTTFTISKRNK